MFNASLNSNKLDGILQMISKRRHGSSSSSETGQQQRCKITSIRNFISRNKIELKIRSDGKKSKIAFLLLEPRYCPRFLWTGFSTAMKYQQYGYQTVLLAYQVVSAAGLWLNMNPTYRLYSRSDMFLSVALMAPITVCSLTASRYCVIFLTVSCILDDINRDLSQQIDRFHRQHMSANISAYKLTSSELKLSDHLDQLIIQYDKLYDVVVAIIEIYSPSILFLLVLDFGQVTFQLYMFYCDLAHATLDDDDLQMIVFTLVASFISFAEVLFIINGTSKFSVKLMQAFEQLHRIGIICVDSRLTESIYGLSMVLQHMQEETIMFYCFALNNSFLTKIIAASCSYLILMIQTV